MTKTSRAYRPSRRDIAAAFQLALRITGDRAAARRIVRRFPGCESSEAFLLEIRSMAIEYRPSVAADAPAGLPELVPVDHITDPALRAFVTRWRELTADEQRAAWNALCGKPFPTQLLRAAVSRLAPDQESNDSPSSGTASPAHLPGTDGLPSDEDIP